jgi:glycerol-3-phosphate dehydrogenase (NAD(P)+)
VGHKAKGVVTLIGPSFAHEVICGYPTMLNAVSANINDAKQVAKLFNNSHFKCIEITDEIGAEIMGALKNVMAIAMGIAYELHTSINTRAAMLAQATKEISNIVKLYGGKNETLTQFCGVGDIYLTCTDEKSRNFSFGKQIANEGMTKALKDNVHTTVEGYRTAKVIFQVIKKNHISSPVFNELCQVLFNQHSIKDFVKNVMSEIIE